MASLPSFETFSLSAELAPSFGLDEAIQRAEVLRQEHPTCVYRVRAKGEDSVDFWIEEKGRDQAQAEQMDTLSRRLMSLRTLWRRRSA